MNGNVDVLDLFKKRIDIRVTWVNSLLLIFMLLFCLVIAERVITTTRLFQRNVALLFLRPTFVKKIAPFYDSLGKLARQDGWSSYWLELRAKDMPLMSMGGQLDPRPPYKSFLVTISRDDTKGAWYEVSVKVTVNGAPSDAQTKLQEVIENRLSASERNSFGDVLRLVESYVPPAPPPLNLQGLSISFVSVPLIIVFIALLIRWQMGVLLRDEIAVLKDFELASCTVKSLLKGALLADDLKNTKLDIFSKRFIFCLGALYFLATIMTGWEANLWFGDDVPKIALAPSPVLDSFIFEFLILSGSIKLMKTRLLHHREN